MGVAHARPKVKYYENKAIKNPLLTAFYTPSTVNTKNVCPYSSVGNISELPGTCIVCDTARKFVLLLSISIFDANCTFCGPNWQPIIGYIFNLRVVLPLFDD